jgi:hypothetical protein
MHRLAKKLSLLLAALLTLSAFAAIVPVSGSTGNIHIESTTAPSPVVTINIGDSISLYFGDVTWSGGTVDLYLSVDGYASLTIPGDVRYGPTFSVAILTGSTADSTTYSGYTVGNNWINGSVPASLEVPGGQYYVKAFDGATAAVAVTDNYFTVDATFEVVPSWGPGQAAIELRGYALPANDFANLSYDSTTIQDLVPTDDLGRFVYTMLAPDLMMPGTTNPGEVLDVYDTIVFTMVVDSTSQTETDTFDEYRRGLEEVQGKTGDTAASGYLFGNGSDFATPGAGLSRVDVEVLGDLTITGLWMHPGELTILWDGSTILGTAEANATHGGFTTTVQVPITSLGSHTVTIDDGKCTFWFLVNVIPTLILVPDSGPAGTVVTAYGYGFPASDGTTYNVTLWWDFTDLCVPVPLDLVVVETDANGYFVTTFLAPHSVGGAHTVNGTADDPATTWADDIFTLHPTLAIMPTNITNDGSIVTVVGTGLDYYAWYDLCLDNTKDFYSADIVIETWGEYFYESAVTSYFVANCTGDFEFEFIAAGFQPGTHVVTLYKLEVMHQLPVIEDFVLFTVWDENPVLDKLDEIMDDLDDIEAAILEIDFSGIQDGIDEIISELTALSDIEGDVSSLITMLTEVKALAETAATQATEASTSAGTAATSADAAETAAEAANSTVSGISMAVYGAIILSLIAALASIVAVITLQRKVA